MIIMSDKMKPKNETEKKLSRITKPEKPPLKKDIERKMFMSYVTANTGLFGYSVITVRNKVAITDAKDLVTLAETIKESRPEIDNKDGVIVMNWRWLDEQD